MDTAGIRQATHRRRCVAANGTPPNTPITTSANPPAYHRPRETLPQGKGCGGPRHPCVCVGTAPREGPAVCGPHARTHTHHPVCRTRSAAGGCWGARRGCRPATRPPRGGGVLCRGTMTVGWSPRCEPSSGGVRRKGVGVREKRGRGGEGGGGRDSGKRRGGAARRESCHGSSCGGNCATGRGFDGGKRERRGR